MYWCNIMVAVAKDDVEEARILTSAQESRVRSILARSRALRPTNFHHVAASITLSPSQPARQRVLLLMASLSIVLLQVSALAGVTAGVDSKTCSSNDVCVSGYYCARQIIGRCMFCRSPGFCAEGNGRFRALRLALEAAVVVALINHRLPTPRLARARDALKPIETSSVYLA